MIHQNTVCFRNAHMLYFASIIENGSGGKQ